MVKTKEIEVVDEDGAALTKIPRSRFLKVVYDQAGLLALGRASSFGVTEMKFIGVMGCLVLRRNLA